MGSVVGQTRRRPSVAVASPPPSPPPPPASPFGVTCPRADTLYDVEGFPSSPFLSTPFAAPFTAPPAAVRQGKYCRTDGHCIFSYNIDITERQLRQFDTAVPSCRTRPGTWYMTYSGSIPGPTITVPAGHEALIRFNNKIANNFFENDTLCTDGGRAGRPISVHFHGANSLAPFDGWAEDVTCRGETKDYVIPSVSAQNEWFHDHALHVTTTNAFHGLSGFFVASGRVADGGCGEPWNLENIEQRLWMLQDTVIDSQCQLYNDVDGAHEDNLYGDINMINGVPFPSQTVDPKTYRFRLLNAAPSRPFLVKFKNAALQDVGPSICQVIAKESGYRQSPVPFPADGLLLGPGERFEVVCDFTTLRGQTLYVWNDRDEDFMKAVPYFCNSHLISKITVSSTIPASRPAFNPALPPSNTLSDRLFSATDKATAQAMAKAGKYHRSFVFGRSGDQWVINGETWDTAKIAASDVGQNTWEIWYLKSGGGWFHPIHLHLVEMEILRRDGGAGIKSYEVDSPADVVYLGPGNEIWMLVRFGAHKGDYMFHCHNLVHEDNDMMRAFSVVDLAPAPADTRASAQRFIVNPLYTLVYGNYKYSDPLFSETAAKPTAQVQSLATRAQTALNANLYRIFYPLPADKASYAPMVNPWEIKVCPAP